MPATLGRLPVRVSVGDGAPVEIGTWEITAHAETGRFEVSTADFADMLRQAADEIAADPVALLDRRFRLVGDEDTNVGIDCRDCDRGGAPIAYLTHETSAYQGTDVVVVDTIAALLAAAVDHDRTAHGRG